MQEGERPVSAGGTRSRSRSRSPLPYFLGKTIEQKVIRELARMPQAPLSETEARLVEKGYCGERYLRAFKIAVEVGSFSFSIRDPGGTDTLECEEHFAPAKGHDISEKTAKLKTLVKGYGEEKGRHLLQELRRLGNEKGDPLAGRVGHWDAEDKLLGFYMSPEINDWCDSDDPCERALYAATRPIPITDEDKAEREARGEPQYRYYAIEDIDRLDQGMAALFDTPKWTEKVIAGDLDVHDLVYRGIRVAEGSPEEARFFNFLQMAVGAANPYRAIDPDKPWRNLFPHGAQQNIVSFAKNKEPNKKAPMVLTSLDLPVIAFIHRPGKETRVLEIPDEATYFEQFPRPDRMKPDGLTAIVASDKGSDGGYRLVRRSSSQHSLGLGRAQTAVASGQLSPPAPSSPVQPELLFPGRVSSNTSPTLATAPEFSNSWQRKASLGTGDAGFGLGLSFESATNRSGFSLSRPSTPEGGARLFGAGAGRSRIPVAVFRSTPISTSTSAPSSPNSSPSPAVVAAPSRVLETALVVRPTADRAAIVRATAPSIPDVVQPSQAGITRRGVPLSRLVTLFSNATSRGATFSTSTSTAAVVVDPMVATVPVKISSRDRLRGGILATVAAMRLRSFGRGVRPAPSETAIQPVVRTPDAASLDVPAPLDSTR